MVTSRTEAYEVLQANGSIANGSNANGTTHRERSLQQTCPSHPEGLDGKVFTGYQGWFRAEGDGCDLGFSHYEKNHAFEPGACTIDLWPDLDEFDEDEKFPTAFQHANGTTAHVFSSLHPKTVDRHFRWMKEYGIDGAFVQRFASHGAKERKNNQKLKTENQKLLLCRDAAVKHGRSWALMYDLSGIQDEDFDRLNKDWKELRTKMQLGTDPAYLHVNGKPLVAIWGVGFGKDRGYSLERTEKFIRFLKKNPEWGGMSIMLGVPYNWREQHKDATNDPKLHSVLQLADVISPWSVGRYRDSVKEADKIRKMQTQDRKWCEKHGGIQTLPVVFPGFSWKNMKGNETTQIPRLGGKFLWNQFEITAKAGNRAAYVAMFDEVDEGTAIFKCTNDPPKGASEFLTYEDLPSDHYLWLCQQGRRLLRGELAKGWITPP